jgi:hypothetical protein
MVSTAADFLALANPKRGTVDHQGQLIHVREMSVKERNEVLKLIKDSPAMVPAYLVRCCVTDANGKPLFSESDADKLAAAAPAVVDLVATEVMKLSGMNNDPND